MADDFITHTLASDERRVRSYMGDIVQGDKIVKQRRDGTWALLGTVFRTTRPYGQIELECYDGTTIVGADEKPMWIVIPKVSTSHYDVPPRPTEAEYGLLPILDPSVLHRSPDHARGHDFQDAGDGLCTVCDTAHD